MSEPLRAGTRVQTPYGSGTVVYVRLRHAPSWSQAEAYSVYLDKRSDDPRYEGTMVRADDVRVHAPSVPITADLERLRAEIARRFGGTS